MTNSAIKVRFSEATPCASPSLSSLGTAATPTLDQGSVIFAHLPQDVTARFNVLESRRFSDVTLLHMRFTKSMESLECIDQEPSYKSMTSGAPPSSQLHLLRDMLTRKGAPRLAGTHHSTTMHQNPLLPPAATRGRRYSSVAAPSSAFLARISSNNQRKCEISENQLTVNVNLSAPAASDRKPSTVYTTSPSTPLYDVSLQHQGVMRVMETWIEVCPLDLDGSKLVRKEVKDFIKKMSSLGPIYKQWAHSMPATLRLEVCIVMRSSLLPVSRLKSSCVVGLRGGRKRVG